MCVIAIKPKNKDIQSKQILQQCFNINRDGAGYMFVNKNKEVVIKKGFMLFDDFYKSLMNDYKTNNLKEQNLVMHFRIGTSGKSRLGCTHPFPITDKFNELEMTRIKTNIGICHNGIISGFNDRLAQYSDTELYIAHVMTPLIRLNLQSYKFKDVQTLIHKTTTSKWAILDKNDEVYVIGDFIEDDGYMYSNGTYKIYTHIPSKYLPTSAWTKDDDEEDDLDVQSDWWERMKFNQQQTKQSQFRDNVKYVMLNKGNVVTGIDVEYLEVDADNKYYFDKNYSIYEKTKDGKMSLIGIKANIYTDETFSIRRDYNYA